MADLTIENVPDDLLKSLERSAATSRRSLNSEVIARLSGSTPAARADPDEFLARLDELHRRLKLPLLTDEFLDLAIEEGRP